MHLTFQLQSGVTLYKCCLVVVVVFFWFPSGAFRGGLQQPHMEFLTSERKMSGFTIRHGCKILLEKNVFPLSAEARPWVC